VHYQIFYVTLTAHTLHKNPLSSQDDSTLAEWKFESCVALKLSGDLSTGVHAICP